MKNYITGVIAILLTGLSIVAADSARSNEFEGIWVRKKYVDSLPQTHSQFAEGPESVTISTKEHRLSWTSYHESSWRPLLDIEVAGATRFLVVGNWEVESSQVTEGLRVPFRETRNGAGKITAIEFLDNSLVQYKEEAFVQLDVPLQQYANNVLLSGTYKDEQGRTFAFSNDGVALWPGTTFPYELTLDSSEAGCDYFQTEDQNEPGQRKRYGFRWNGEELQLFKIIYDSAVPIQCEKEPFVSLIRH